MGNHYNGNPFTSSYYATSNTKIQIEQCFQATDVCALVDGDLLYAVVS